MSFRDCLMGGGTSKCDRPRAEATGKSSADVEVTKKFSGRNNNVTLLDLTDAICNESVCPMIKDGIVVFQDPDHLTATFSRTLAPKFVPFFH